MNFLTRLASWLRGGDHHLNPAELGLVDMVAQSLLERDRETLNCQVSRIRLVQRPQPFRLTICFYSKQTDLPLFDQCEYEVCLAQITYTGSEKKRRKVKVILHNGFLQSIEGHIPNAPLNPTECDVQLWPQVKSTTPTALDRLEHGDRNTADANPK